MAVMGGWKMFIRNGGNPGMGGGDFIMGGGWKIFKVSLQSWLKGPNPYFKKTPLYCLLPPFSKFVHPPTSLSPPTPTPPVLSAVLVLWLNG